MIQVILYLILLIQKKNWLKNKKYFSIFFEIEQNIIENLNNEQEEENEEKEENCSENENTSE